MDLPPIRGEATHNTSGWLSRRTVNGFASENVDLSTLHCVLAAYSALSCGSIVRISQSHHNILEHIRSVGLPLHMEKDNSSRPIINAPYVLAAKTVDPSATAIGLSNMRRDVFFLGSENPLDRLQFAGDHLGGILSLGDETDFLSWLGSVGSVRTRGRSDSAVLVADLSTEFGKASALRALGVGVGVVAYPSPTFADSLHEFQNAAALSGTTFRYGSTVGSSLSIIQSAMKIRNGNPISRIEFDLESDLCESIQDGPEQRFLDHRDLIDAIKLISYASFGTVRSLARIPIERRFGHTNVRAIKVVLEKRNSTVASWVLAGGQPVSRSAGRRAMRATDAHGRLYYSCHIQDTEQLRMISLLSEVFAQ